MTTNDLNTNEGIAAHIKTFTDDQLRTLAAAPTTIANVVFQAAADGELIVRGADALSTLIDRVNMPGRGS